MQREFQWRWASITLFSPLFLLKQEKNSIKEWSKVKGSRVITEIRVIAQAERSPGMTEWIKVINNRERCRVSARKKVNSTERKEWGKHEKKSGKNYRQIKYCKVSRSSISIAFTSAFSQCPSLSLSVSRLSRCLSHSLPLISVSDSAFTLVPE